LVVMGFEFRASHLQSRCLKSILLWLFWGWNLGNYLPRLSSSSDSPYHSLPSS
jgi:hypothetical protein